MVIDGPSRSVRFVLYFAGDFKLTGRDRSPVGGAGAGKLRKYGECRRLLRLGGGLIYDLVLFVGG